MPGLIPTVVLGTTSTSTVTQQNEVLASARTALLQLEQYLNYTNSNTITINFGTSSTNIAFSTANLIADIDLKGQNILIPTGSGTTTIDMATYWVLPPYQRFAVLQHEIMTIVFGLTGVLDPTTGTLVSGATLPTAYDTCIDWNSGTPLFTSETITALTGNTVPVHMPSGLSSQQLYRITAGRDGGFLNIMNPQVEKYNQGTDLINNAMAMSARAPVLDARLFDVYYYCAQNSDVYAVWLTSGFAFSLWTHYENNGRHEGRNPNALFNTNDYLAANPDVALSGVNPLTQYATTGWKEDRNLS